MRQGLHLLGYDWLKGASAMSASLAEGLAGGATKQRASGDAGKKATTPAPAAPPPDSAVETKPKQKAGSFWTAPLVGSVPGWGVAAGGAAVVAVAVALLVRSR